MDFLEIILANLNFNIYLEIINIYIKFAFYSLYDMHNEIINLNLSVKPAIIVPNSKKC